jgi:CubicO group peptidase (beta-lactamase class C family)
MMLALLAAAALGGEVTEDRALAARLDPALRAEATAGVSGVVLVARDDTVRFERLYGAAAATGVAPDRLAFWIASDSKQFTATAILRLARFGRLGLDDHLERFFHDVPADKRAITIRQLLTHTSGMPTAYRAEGIADRDAAVAATLHLTLVAPPGTRYSYSNDGYTLLAAIVEIASGVSFDRYLCDSLFAPNGLVHTGVWGSEDPATTIAPLADPGRARHGRAHIYESGHSVANWGLRGPGGVYSTARDLATWIQALRSGRVLGAEGLAELLGHDVVVRTDSSGTSYAGDGWGLRVEGGRDVSYGHVGDDDWLGHSAVLHFTPGGDIRVVLANSGESGDDGWAVRVNRVVRRAMEAPP